MFKKFLEITHDIFFDFTFFKKNYSSLNLHQTGFEKNLNFNWLTWFIRFSKGNNIILTYKGRFTFVITQKEKEILLYIQKVLNFNIV